MAFDINSFDFGAMTSTNGNPFDNKKTFERDDRFYVLPKDANGNGVAIIAFLPDVEKHTLIRMNKINTTVNDNGKRKFLSTWSPYSIGKPCPFNETAVRLWNEGDKDGYRLLAPQTRYICNIKVIKDPTNPENEGKIFLYEMSKTLTKKIQEAVQPDETAMKLGEKPKEVFNPLRGWIFKLVAKKGDNGFTSYDSSIFQHVGDGKSIYGDITSQEDIQSAGTKAMDDITNKTYNLKEFHAETFFKAYEELYSELQRLVGGKYGIPAKTTATTVTSAPSVQINETSANVSVEVTSAEPTVTATVTPTPAPTSNNDIDSLLADL